MSRYHAEVGPVVWFGEAENEEEAAYAALERALPRPEASVSVYELRDPVVFEVAHSLKIVRRTS